MRANRGRRLDLIVSCSRRAHRRILLVTDTFEGTVIKKSRGLLDGSNMYRRLKVSLEDGTTITVRVNRGLWNDVAVGDTAWKESGKDPVKR